MAASTSKHIISILLANESGVLSRVAGLFSARGYNIESLTVAPTNNPSLSRITIVTQGEARLAEQIVKQLHKLIDVVDAIDLSGGKHIEQEVLLIKLACDCAKTQDLQRAISPYNANIISCDTDLCIVGMNDSSRKIDEFIGAVEQEWEIKEIARSGAISLGCGDTLLSL